MMTIYFVDTIQDFRALPVDLQNAINGQIFNPNGLRFIANIRKAERKTAIQNAVVQALKDGAISENLAVTILKGNNAYGPKGKAALYTVSGEAK